MYEFSLVLVQNQVGYKETLDLLLCLTIPKPIGSVASWEGSEVANFETGPVNFETGLGNFETGSGNFEIGLGNFETWLEGMSKKVSELDPFSELGAKEVSIAYGLQRVFMWYNLQKSEPGVLGPRNTIGKLSQ